MLCCDGAGTGSTANAQRSYDNGAGKIEEGKRRRTAMAQALRSGQKHKEATQEPFPRQREAEDVHARVWKRT